MRMRRASVVPHDPHPLHRRSGPRGDADVRQRLARDPDAEQWHGARPGRGMLVEALHEGDRDRQHEEDAEGEADRHPAIIAAAADDTSERATVRA